MGSNFGLKNCLPQIDLRARYRALAPMGSNFGLKNFFAANRPPGPVSSSRTDREQLWSQKFFCRKSTSGPGIELSDQWGAISVSSTFCRDRASFSWEMVSGAMYPMLTSWTGHGKIFQSPDCTVNMVHLEKSDSRAGLRGSEHGRVGGTFGPNKRVHHWGMTVGPVGCALLVEHKSEVGEVQMWQGH